MSDRKQDHPSAGRREIFGVLGIALVPLIAWVAEAATGKEKDDQIVLCVAPFQNNTADESLDGLAFAFTDLLMFELADRENIVVVDRERLQDVLQEHTLSLQNIGDATAFAKAGEVLGARKIVTGGLMEAGGKLRVIGHVFDVHSGAIQTSTSSEGERANLEQIAGKLSASLGEALKAPLDLGRYEKAGTSPSASLHFLRGLGFYQAGNYNRAIMEFMRCGDRDPEHPLYRFWIGQSYFAMDEYRHAAIELKKFQVNQPTSEKGKKAEALIRKCEAHRAANPEIKSLLQLRE
jgi:TolB-like protein